MPALAKPPARLPHFVPHSTPKNAGASAGAGTFLPSTIANPPAHAQHSKDLDHLAHDARNVLSGLLLHSELLATPGVLNQQHGHYAQELQGIADASIKILEAILERASTPNSPGASPHPPVATHVPIPSVPVTDAADEARRLQPLLSALAGPAIRLSVATMPCAGRTALAVEDLTRILINLVRNAADAMPSGGHIRITAQYGDGLSFLDPEDADVFGPPNTVVISVSDSGPGVPKALRDEIFETGFSTHCNSNNWPAPRRRGLGLSIVRNLVEAAGGTVQLAPVSTRGACFAIQLPITSGTCAAPQNGPLAADSRVKGCIECH
jgi:signal transduction histidine kinase